MTLDAFSNPLFRLGYGSQAPLEAAEGIRRRTGEQRAGPSPLFGGGPSPPGRAGGYDRLFLLLRH